MHNLSLKLKINLVLLLLMALLTWYFLQQIDAQEQILTRNQVEANNQARPLSSFSGGDYQDLLDSCPPPYRDTYKENITANQQIKSYYRYMIACNAILIMVIIVVYKFANQKAAG